MISRRAFMQTVAAAAAGMVFDPERLLWVPGQKTIFVMPPAPPLFDAAAYVSRHWGALKWGGWGLGPMNISAWRHYLETIVQVDQVKLLPRADYKIPSEVDTRNVIREINRRLDVPMAMPRGDDGIVVNLWNEMEPSSTVEIQK